MTRCPYCKGKVKIIDIDVDRNWDDMGVDHLAFKDLVFECNECGKESIFNLVDGGWQNTDYDPINLETGKSIYEEPQE